MKTLVGFCTFGNLNFTKLAVESIIKTTKNDIDFFGVVGKPGDMETLSWLNDMGIPNIYHTENFGFPYSLNDIFDYAWKYNNYDNLIIMGNDIIVYDYAIDSLINIANTTEYLVISALQYDVRDLVKEFPHTKVYFPGSSHKITDFSSECWNLFTNYSDEITIADMQLFDIQNLCLYKRKVFDVIGYADVNFYPAYYVDNDYARRIVIAKLKCCSLVNARFFHFWSRTIHQESGGSNPYYFENNRKYYKMKWGGDFGSETKNPGIIIDKRDYELNVINKWKK
jgi:GT2 family glycosyltransferase